MAKGKADPDWKQKVLKWKASGKSCAAWSKENNIPYTTLLGWKYRLENAGNNCQIVKRSAGFIELKDKLPSNSGIALEYRGIKICLEPGFNPSVLRQCLTCLRGIVC